ncbi:Lipoprotein (plasmid) [Caballeronia sp. S22]
MIAKACAWVLVLMAGSAAAAPCYNDGDVVTLEGTATRQAAHEGDASAKPAWVLSLSGPICVLSASTGQNARQQSNVSAVQIIDATPTENARIQVTGKLVTGNVSGYYAVPTAIWVLKQRVLSGQ